MKKVIKVICLLFIITLFIGCDVSNSSNNGNESSNNKTTLTIRNESSHNIIDVNWNNISFTSGLESINSSASITMDIPAGSGYIRFRPCSNFIRLKTQQWVTAEEGIENVIIIINNTIVEREDNGSSGTFASFASEHASIINWTVTPVGNPTTTDINFVFTDSPVLLTVSNISIINDGGSAVKGYLTGEGLMRTLTISGVIAGNVKISIDHPIINSEPQTITLSALGDITWTASAVNSTLLDNLYTSAITFTFNRDPGLLSETNFTITPDTGSATRGILSGSGLMRTLNVHNVNAGTVFVSVNSHGIVNTPQAVTIVSSDFTVTWTAEAIGSPTTTAINFTFSRDPGLLTVSDFVIAPGTGSATKGVLSGGRIVWTLTVSDVKEGTVMTSVSWPFVDQTPKEVMVYAAASP